MVSLRLETVGESLFAEDPEKLYLFQSLSKNPLETIEIKDLILFLTDKTIVKILCYCLPISITRDIVIDMLAIKLSTENKKKLLEVKNVLNSKKYSQFMLERNIKNCFFDLLDITFATMLKRPPFSWDFLLERFYLLASIDLMKLLLQDDIVLQKNIFGVLEKCNRIDPSTFGRFLKVVQTEKKLKNETSY